MPNPPDSPSTFPRLVGHAVERVEDAALLTGRGRFAHDVGERSGTAHAAVLRSPHAHAEIVSLDAAAALSMPEVVTVLTGEEVAAWSRPFIAGVKQPMRHYALAVDRVRYTGEPVAVVVARDRYGAEDALERIEVEYRELDPVVDAVAAAAPGAPLLHRDVGSNVVSDRRLRYGDPDAAFASAAHRVAISVRYPRNACTPIEGFVVVAEHLGDDGYDVLSNFQGPFTLHPVMARALGVPGARLRLRSPRDSGGSFGVKQAVFPYVVVMCLASRKARCPVKWVEDRLEHLLAATSATNRVTTLEAAVTGDGTITALRWDQLDDCGAYLRAPEPASLYRTHGHMTGPYRIAHLEIHNRVVLTNKTPTGLNRGFGGPQVYFALERLVHRIAKTLGLDPLDVIRRNLVPGEAFPYRAASGSRLDSGDYRAALDTATAGGRLDRLRARRGGARAAGRRYGIGFAAVVEPSISNMGYITMALTAGERARVGPKDGAAASATVSIDPIGSIAAHVASVPQGQGHRTVLAQVIADVLGVELDDVTVNVEHDTQKDPWSIAAGNYSSRFSGAVARAAHLAAMKLRERLARIASTGLNATPEALVFAGGRIFAADNPENAIPLGRAAGIAHWSPGSLPEHAEPGLRETVLWSMPGLDPPDEDDRVNSSGAYGFIFDMCGVEVDDAGRVRIDEYVTMHDAGTRLNPALVDGQIRGGFAHGVGAALYEELAYAGDGSFLSGTFADYLVPTACEVPAPTILHMESPSPFTPLGAKGVGEGNTMSTPVCLANAVADALDFDDVELPMTPSKVASWLAGEEPLPPSGACGPGAITEVGVAQVEAGSTTPATPEVEDERSSKAPARVTAPPEPAAPGSTVLDSEKLSADGADAITGAGEVRIGVAPAALWPILLDAERLARVIARVIMGLVPPTAGRAVVGGVDYREASRGDIRRLRRDIQMVFQDPVDSLNPRMTVEQNVRDPLRNAREPLSDVDGRIDRVLRQVGLGSEFRRLRPRRLSGGQAQRVALSRALVVEPRVIVFDEPTSALDVTVQAQILDFLRVLMADGTRSYVFVSHDLATVQGLCDRVAVLYLGRIVEQEPADEVLERPCHLYTRALVDAVSTLSSRRTVVGTRLKRDLDEAWEAERCSLEPRCPHGEAACREPQTLRDLTRGHQAACWKA